MNIVDINDDLDHELSYMSLHERADRLRGERQWRNHIQLMEQENELPIMNPGSQPNWNQLMRDGIPDLGDQARHYAYTHYLGVVLDDDEVDALTYGDMAILAQGTVSKDMMRQEKTSQHSQKQFIQVLGTKRNVYSFSYDDQTIDRHDATQQSGL